LSDALSVRNLVKRYGSVEALRGVSLEAESGELIGLIGPNGAGKSTLVKIATGLVRASGGEVAICGQPARSEAARASLGYLAELFRYPGWLSAEELLGFHQQLSGSKGGAAERGELLDLVGLGEASQRRIGTMSKGMQQRLGIAQALIGSPRLLLLDEPTSALDPAGRHTVRNLLAELRSRGVAVLLNSHLLSEVEMVCDRVILLVEGKVKAEGTPDQLTGRAGVEIETDQGTQRYPDAGREATPDIVARLVAAGERVYAVRPLHSTLEEVYLEAVEEGPA
jgi:ABC-2 type transport system ATP-binding protein